jgi:hypothetical protein
LVLVFKSNWISLFSSFINIIPPKREAMGIFKTIFITLTALYSFANSAPLNPPYCTVLPVVYYSYGNIALSVQNKAYPEIHNKGVNYTPAVTNHTGLVEHYFTIPQLTYETDIFSLINRKLLYSPTLGAQDQIPAYTRPSKWPNLREIYFPAVHPPEEPDILWMGSMSCNEETNLPQNTI